jgi:hypothetical protein
MWPHTDYTHIPIWIFPSFTFSYENSSNIMTKNKNVIFPRLLPHQDSCMNTTSMCMNSSPWIYSLGGGRHQFAESFLSFPARPRSWCTWWWWWCSSFPSWSEEKILCVENIRNLQMKIVNMKKTICHRKTIWHYIKRVEN